MPAPLTRRAFLKLTALLTSGAAFARLPALALLGLPGRAIAAAQACLPVWGLEVPMSVPFAVGDDCAPPPTATETPTLTTAATLTATSTPSPTATATTTPTALPPATPTPWRVRLPWMSNG